MLNEAAFREFYGATAASLRKYVARASGSIEGADDIVQEAFLRVLRKHPPDTVDLDSLRAYVYRIASNLIVDVWRKRRYESGYAATHTEHVYSDGLPEDMQRIFEQLRPIDRQLMWLAYVEGQSHRDIARALGLRDGSIRVMLSRARERLNALLGNAPVSNPNPRRERKEDAPKLRIPI